MTEEDFIKRLSSTPNPVVVDFWASWCVPCQAIATTINTLGAEYAGRVDLWKIDADEQHDLVRSLRIYGIPTLIAYRDGQEVGRHTGAASTRKLAALFESALTGTKPEQTGPELPDRFIRMGAGLALASLAVLRGLSGTGLLAAGVGAVIMFTGVYDRCPIYRMVSTRLKDILQR